MRNLFFGFLITKVYFFQVLLSYYIIFILKISNRKKKFKKKINVLVLNKDRFDKSQYLFEKLDHYHLYYLPVKIQSLLLTKWQRQLNNLSNKNYNNNRAKINLLNNSNTEISKIRDEYLKFLEKLLPRIFRILDIKILFSGSVHYIQDHDIATVAKNLNIPFVIFHRENIFLTNAQEKFQIKQYQNYVNSNADIIFVNNQITKDIIKKKIGKRSKIVIIPKYLKNNKLKNNENFITLFSFTNNYGIGALNFFNNNIRWHKLFYAVHLNFFKLVEKYPKKKFIIKIKWTGNWQKSVLNIWDKNFNKPFPRNLKILDENYESTDIIKKSKFIISFNSTAILEAGLLKKEVIIPNFFECNNRLLGKFSFGNNAEARKFFKIADTEISFKKLIEKEIQRKKSYSSLKLSKKIFINKMLNVSKNLLPIKHNVDKNIKNILNQCSDAIKLSENDLCFFIRPKFYHLENIIPIIYYLKKNYNIKKKIRIILNRIEDYEYLKSNLSTYNSIRNISEINFISSRKGIYNRLTNFFLFVKIFSKKQIFYIYKPGKFIRFFLKLNKIILGSKINYLILNYHQKLISEPTLKILKSIEEKEVSFSDQIVTNISENYLSNSLYKENFHKIIKLDVSRFSNFWTKKILSEENKINKKLPKNSIFFPLAVLERKLYDQYIDFKVYIEKIILLLKRKNKKFNIIFRPHPTTNIIELKKFLKKIEFKNYKISYAHYFYLIKNTDFSVRYLSSTIDCSNPILKKKLFRFYPNNFIKKDRLIHFLDKKFDYDKFIYNFDSKIADKTILRQLVK